MTTPTPAPTQTQHPWRATVRTVFAALVAAATLLPWILAGAHLDGTVLGAQAIAVAGEKRYRIWQIYLAGCAHGFQNEWMNVYQVLARKEGETSNPLPLTRDYMYGAV